METVTTQLGHRRVELALAAASAPIVLGALSIFYGTSTMSLLWVGVGVGLLVFALGFFLLGRVRAVRVVPFKFWQSPLLWVPITVAIATAVFARVLA